MKPCDICLEKVCKGPNGPGSCNCETCSVKDDCPRKLRATIRLTLKCTQSCGHCCFECSPKEETHMSIETAKKLSQFIKNNEIHSVNLMGGEIFCNPNWKEILDIIIPQVSYALIVSNGDWVEFEPDFAKYLTKYKNCWVCISKDEWHTMKNVDKAIEILENNGILYSTPNHKEEEFNMIPIGRAELNFGLYSMFGCYCHNPEKQYTFLIDEKGDIFKCNFGVWNYDTINDYLNGGFPVRFKEFNKVFYDVFIPSCSSCIRSFNREF